jgi:PQQ-dependent catabolism-associated CXXCW motif protein
MRFARVLLAPIFLVASLAQAGVPEPSGYFSGDIHSPTPGTLRGGTVIHTDKLPALLKRGAMVIDSSDFPHRPDALPKDSVWMPLPHKAIPGAVWMPGSGAPKVDPNFEAFMRKELEAMSDGNPERPVVVYCHEKCWLSWNAAKRVIEYGYKNVYWYPEGIEGWLADKRVTLIIKPTTP